MTVTYTPVSSLDEVDLYSLYDACADVIDRSFTWWPEGVNTPELKREFYTQFLRECSTLGMGAAPYLRENFFVFKAQIDGVDSLVSAGYVDEGGCYHCLWYLTKPDANGSRNWLYTTIGDEHALYRSRGITSMRIITYEESLIARNIRMREAAGAIVVLDKTFVDDTNVSYTLKVNEA